MKNRLYIASHGADCFLHKYKATVAVASVAFSLSKNLFFDRLTEVKEAVKTSNATPKCMWILERGALRSKSKRLAEQAILYPHPSKIKDFATFPQGKALS